MRIATILHRTLIAFLENIWSGYVRAFEEKDSKPYIYESEPTHRPQWFAKFPRYLFRDDKNAKHAILTQSKCDQAYACLYTLITKLFEGKPHPKNIIVSVNLAQT